MHLYVSTINRKRNIYISMIQRTRKSESVMTGDNNALLSSI